MWDLWRKQRRWDGLFSKYLFPSPVSIIPLFLCNVWFACRRRLGMWRYETTASLNMALLDSPIIVSSKSFRNFESDTLQEPETDGSSCSDSQRRHYLSGHFYNHFPSAQFSHKSVISDIFSVLLCNLPNFGSLFKYSVSHLLGSRVGRSNLVKRSSVQWGWLNPCLLPTLFWSHFMWTL